MRRQIYSLLVVLFILMSFRSVCAQCDSKIQAETKLITEQRGEITLKINTSYSYVYTLQSISGKGTEKISSDKDSGNSTKKIEVTDLSKFYVVKVEFLNEENEICKVLQTNILAFEP